MKNLKGRIQRRAAELWEAAGRPEGRDLEYWLQAERELGDMSTAGEEDPLAALDDFEPGSLAPSRKE